MEVDVVNEFSIEVVLYVCFVYAVHLRGEDVRVRTYAGMDPFYYFLPPDRIVVRNEVRKWVTPTQRDKHLCEKNEYSPTLHKCPLWKPPPFKEYYKNDEFVYDKPVLIICNKYNTEWGRMPINFIPTSVLFDVVDMLQPRYHIIYIRQHHNKVHPGYSVDDGKVMDLKDIETLRRKNVAIFDDLIQNDPYNLTKLRLFANCDHYISVQGGNAHLCAFFAHKLLILHVAGPELRSGVYDGWYKSFRECVSISIVTQPVDLLPRAQEIWQNDDQFPLGNGGGTSCSSTDS